MSGFLKLTRRRYKRCRSKDLRPVLVNVNSIMCIQEHPYGGSRLTLCVDGLIERVLYVTSAPDQIFAMIEKSVLGLLRLAISALISVSASNVRSAKISAGILVSAWTRTSSTISVSTVPSVRCCHEASGRASA